MNLKLKSNIGDCYTLYKIAQLGIRAMKVSELFEFDLLAHNNVRLEVKTALMRIAEKKIQRKKGLVIAKWKIWEFGNQSTTAEAIGNSSMKFTHIERDRKCDFFVFVCLDKKYNLIKSYVVPKKIVGKRRLIVIGNSTKHRYEPYRERWDLIKDYINQSD